MRLFTGLDLPGEVETQLDRLLKELRPKAHINWSPVANLHITTKFIGEWPEAQLPELISALRTVPKPSAPMRIVIRGAGWFPNPHQPRVLFAGIEIQPEGSLHELARATDAACAAIGVEPEQKPYKPHLTLARIKGGQDIAEVRRAIAQRPSLEFGGAFTPASYFLYLSSPGPRGSVYTKLSEFPLA